MARTKPHRPPRSRLTHPKRRRREARRLKDLRNAAQEPRRTQGRA